MIHLALPPDKPPASIVQAITTDQPIRAGDPRIPALTDDMLLSLVECATREYRRAVDAAVKHVMPHWQTRNSLPWQWEIPPVLDELLNEAAMRKLPVNPL